ncbi:BRcat and Rcat domain-containing protein [Aspergillus novofumigatus IBT 16806]|uniref:RING finger protein n=1 Tax=Aspergillus novofumigatus (strain IBT 16806) TaxID=1392255 RepID=A0A2I1CPH5_ASPN1|nr:RING finger protein [Aspergillus novofumigatus IBT 16806]PKX99530.1 RING finger protein [Aspergillus novofumigatus IBT 16806]
MAFVLAPEIDQPTADLLVQLQLQDASLYFKSSKGKSRDPTDEELAFQLQNKELEIISHFAAAVQADRCIVAVNQVEEENACNNQDIARQWMENGCLESSADFKSKSVTLDDETLAKLQILYVSGMEGYQNIGIIGEFVNMACVPCQHEYYYPSRIFLKSNLIEQYEKKKIEFKTPNRTYCYYSECDAFINTSHINGEVATCPSCGHITYTNCKGRAHMGDYLNNTAMQQLLATAQENRWQRCYSCWRMVELDHGCNHIMFDERRLLARAYQLIDRDGDQPLAAKPPPDINEPRLEGHLAMETNKFHIESQEAQPEQADEESHAAPEASASPSSQTPRDILVARTIQELRENHECMHDRWKYIRGPHRCEECSYYLREYIFECRQCRIQACNRCRRNRL